MKKSLYAYSLLVIILTACASAHVNPNMINQSAFPPDFKDPNQILLIQKRTSGINARGMNNYLNKSFQKYYTGKYEMASREEIESNPKYQDKNIYRYVLSDQTWSSTQTILAQKSTHNEIQYNNSYSIDYRLYDRREDKNYPTLGIESSVPAKAMKRVAATLNAKLSK